MSEQATSGISAMQRSTSAVQSVVLVTSGDEQSKPSLTKYARHDGSSIVQSGHGVAEASQHMMILAQNVPMTRLHATAPFSDGQLASVGGPASGSPTHSQEP